jgi:hypothetical protein
VKQYETKAINKETKAKQTPEMETIRLPEL